MHAVVQLDRRQTVASVGPQRTANIDNFIVQNASAEAIGKL